MSEFELIPHDVARAPVDAAISLADTWLENSEEDDDSYDLARIAQAQPLLSEAQEQDICQRMEHAALSLLTHLTESPKLLSLLQQFAEETDQELARHHHNKGDQKVRLHAAELNLFGRIDELRLYYYLRKQGRRNLEAAIQERRRRLKRKLADWQPPAYLIVRFMNEADLAPLSRNHSKRIRELLGNYHRQRNRMAQANLRLVYSVANKFRYLGLSYEDLVQEGSLGLIKAIERYNVKKGFRFSTYAYRVISQTIHLALDKNSSLVRKPYKLLREKAVVDQTRTRLEQQLGKTPSARELAGALPDTVTRKRSHTDNHANVTADTQKLYAQSGDPADHQAMSEMDQNWQTGRAYTHSLLEKLIDGLPHREQTILRMRFGVGVPKQYTLEEISQRLSLSRERVRQIAQNSVARLRERLETDGNSKPI